MISKKTLLREWTAEIEKFKGELVATRQRNGVYLSTESYEGMVGESESRRILSEEQQARIETMEVNLRNKVQELFSLTNNFNILKKDNDGTKQLLDNTKDVLEKTEIVLADTRQNLAEEAILCKAHQATEDQLNNVGGELILTLERTVGDINGLHSKLKRKSDLQLLNREGWKASQGKVVDITQLVESNLEEFRSEQELLVTRLSGRMQSFVQEELDKLGVTQDLLKEKVSSFESSANEVVQQTSGAKEDMNAVLEEIKILREDIKRKVGEGLNGLSVAAGRISAEIINELGSFHTQVCFYTRSFLASVTNIDQLHTSYSSLGKDFKNIFEELFKHVNTQKAEADDLRQKASSAAKAAVQADANVAARLEICLIEERVQASQERQGLLAQITDLVNKSGEVQDARWKSKLNAVREEVLSSKSELQMADEGYNTGMDVWSQKEKLLVEEVLKSRDTLKGRMKDDWKAINEHNTSIQATTKSVHEETIRIVDAQMKDMATQMQALDDFVTRARKQNELHHSTHVGSLEGLTSTVRQSYSSIGDHFVSTYDRVRHIGEDISTQSTSLQASLPPLSSIIQQPLAELRSNISGAPLKEYTPTGETPRKTQYQYPTTLPRTESHDRLLGRKPSAPPPSPRRSPSKSVVYTDTPATDGDLHPTSTSPSKEANPGGLREVSLNVNASLVRNHSDSSAPTLLTTGKADPENVGMAPPPLKRQATMESKLPTKFGGGRMPGVVKLEGRENLGASFGSGRRLRSSPTDHERRGG